MWVTPICGNIYTCIRIHTPIHIYIHIHPYTPISIRLTLWLYLRDVRLGGLARADIHTRSTLVDISTHAYACIHPYTHTYTTIYRQPLCVPLERAVCVLRFRSPFSSCARGRLRRKGVLAFERRMGEYVYAYMYRCVYV